MNSSIIIVGATLVKIATLGGVGIAITTSLKWFHTFDVNFKKKGGDTKHDYDNIGKELRLNR